MAIPFKSSASIRSSEHLLNLCFERSFKELKEFFTAGSVIHFSHITPGLRCSLEFFGMLSSLLLSKEYDKFTFTLAGGKKVEIKFSGNLNQPGEYWTIAQEAEKFVFTKYFMADEWTQPRMVESWIMCRD